MQKYLKETSFVQISETFFLSGTFSNIHDGGKVCKEMQSCGCSCRCCGTFFSKVPITKMTLEYNNRLDER